MSEYYSNADNYEEELIYRDKTTMEKIFSMRTLKTIFKSIMWVLVVIVYGMIFFRLCTGKPPKSVSGILWTEDALAAYEEYGNNILIYSHEPVENIAEDGVSGIYDIVYIPAAKTLQMTVRYNKNLAESYYENEVQKRRDEIQESVIKSEGYNSAQLSTLTKEQREAYNALIDERLAKSLEEDPIRVSDSEFPFVFVLRDNYGNIYTTYEYTADTKTLYRYQRLSFEGIDLFGEEQVMPETYYPSPKAENPSYIFKGPHAGKSDEITYLYLDMYYDIKVDVYGEAFAYPLQVYVSDVELEPYDFSKELPHGLAEDITKVTVTNSEP